MKIVVYGPQKRTGALHDGSVVDLSGAFAKYAAEKNNEPHAIALAEVLVPSDLARLIEAGPRALDNAEQACDYLFGRAHDQTVAQLAEAGGNGDGRPSVGLGAIVPGEDADAYPTGRVGSAASCGHHAAETAAHDDRAALGQLTPNRLRETLLLLAGIARAHHRDVGHAGIFSG